MKKSKIQFEVELDEQNIPENIYWHATDKEDDGLEQTKSISISLWDHFHKNTMRIDLWTKDMPLDEQKRFYVDSIGGLAQSILSATGDEYMASEMNKLCENFIKHIQEEEKQRTAAAAAEIVWVSVSGDGFELSGMGYRVSDVRHCISEL